MVLAPDKRAQAAAKREPRDRDARAGAPDPAATPSAEATGVRARGGRRRAHPQNPKDDRCRR